MIFDPWFFSSNNPPLGPDSGAEDVSQMVMEILTIVGNLPRTG
jgi:hypothetical protein